MSEKLVKCHKGCAEMHDRVARWMQEYNATPDWHESKMMAAESCGLISDMEVMLHASTHELEVCLHDEYYFPRLDWLNGLRHVAGMFTALAVGTNKFEDHLRHTVECDYEMANGRPCVCGVTQLRIRMREWIDKNEKMLSTNRFDIMKGNLVDRRVMDVAMCESTHKAEVKEKFTDVHTDQYQGRVKRVPAYSKGHAATCPCTWCQGRREEAKEDSASLSNVGILRNAGWSQEQLDELLDDTLENRKHEHVDRCTCIRCRAMKTLDEQAMHEEDDAPDETVLIVTRVQGRLLVLTRQLMKYDVAVKYKNTFPEGPRDSIEFVHAPRGFDLRTPAEETDDEVARSVLKDIARVSADTFQKRRGD